MGLREWWASRRAAAPTDGPLSGEDQAHVRRLAQRSFATHGLEVVPDGADGLVGDGMTYGLTNLMRGLRAAPRRDWPGFVDEHVEAMLATHRADGPAPTLGEISEQLLIKLRLAEDLPERPTYAPEVAPGLLALIAVDHPTHVEELLSDEAVAALGPFADVWTLALSNLSRLPPPQRQTMGPADDPTAAVHAFVADDFFGASRLLTLEDVLAGAGLPAAPHGILIAVPHRHVLAVHPVTGAGVVTALNTLTVLAVDEHDAEPGPISPEVYYRDPDGVMSVITSTAENGDIGVVIDGALARAFDDLGLLD